MSAIIEEHQVRSFELEEEMGESNVSRWLVVLLIANILTVPVRAQQATQQPAQPVAQATTAQQQTGHVLSAETHKSHHSTSVYNSSTGQYSHGGGTSVQR